MPRLMASHTVIAADLPGTGESGIPDDGYDKRTTAHRLRKLVQKLGLGRIAIVGHDIGAMVGLAYAAELPAEVSTLVFMEAPPPSDVFYQLPALAPPAEGVLLVVLPLARRPERARRHGHRRVRADRLRPGPRGRGARVLPRVRAGHRGQPPARRAAAGHARDRDRRRVRHGAARRPAPAPVREPGDAGGDRRLGALDPEEQPAALAERLLSILP